MGMDSHFNGEKEGRIPEELDVTWTTLLTILDITVGSLESEVRNLYSLGPSWDTMLVRIVERG